MNLVTIKWSARPLNCNALAATKSASQMGGSPTPRIRREILVPVPDPNFTADYMFTFFGRLHGMDDRQINARKTRLFSYFGIDAFKDKNIEELSTGMKQRDAITGEKERGTLASMLLTPVKRNEIVIGKLVSLAILSGLSSTAYSAAMIIAMPLMNSLTSKAGVSGFGDLSFSVLQAIQLLVIMLLLVFLYVSVISLLAVLAKDVKAASTYISPLYIVVTIVGMMSMFSSDREHPVFHYMIPVYGNALAIANLCDNGLAMTPRQSGGLFRLIIDGSLV